MFCIFRYLCVTVYIQLFSFRAASMCLINSVVVVVVHCETTGASASRGVPALMLSPSFQLFTVTHCADC